MLSNCVILVFCGNIDLNTVSFRASFYPIALATVLCYFTLYSPQPLLPILSEHFGVAPSSAGSLITITLLPLAIAPLIYGYILKAVSPIRLLQSVLLVIAFTSVAFALVAEFSQLLLVRLIQGILLPAALTAITTYIATTYSPAYLQQTISVYIACTIVGGFFGRLMAGFFSTYFDWHDFYFLLSAALLLNCVWLNRTYRFSIAVRHVPKADSFHKRDLVPEKAQENNTSLSASFFQFAGIFELLRNSDLVRIYGSIFCLFFTFVALLNYLPFMLSSGDQKASSFFIGLMYSGYLVGIFTSLKANAWAGWIGSPKKLMLFAYCVLAVMITLMINSNIMWLFIELCVFCGAMFIVHSVAAAQVNLRSPEQKSLVNALYMTFYYSGGALGSYLPGIIFQNFGQFWFLSGLLGVSVVGIALLLNLNDLKAAGASTNKVA